MKISCLIIKGLVLSLVCLSSFSVAAISSPQIKGDYKSSLATVANTDQGHWLQYTEFSSNKIQLRKEKNIFKRLDVASQRFFKRNHDPKPKRFREPGKKQATAALVLGILGLIVTPFPFSILAIIFGAISLKKYRQGYHDQRGKAKAGLILGIVGMALFIALLGLTLALPFLFI